MSNRSKPTIVVSQPGTIVDSFYKKTQNNSPSPQLTLSSKQILESVVGGYDGAIYTAAIFAKTIISNHDKDGYKNYFRDSILPHVGDRDTIKHIYEHLKGYRGHKNPYNTLLLAYLNPHYKIWKPSKTPQGKEVVVGHEITNAFKKYFASF